MKYRLALLLGLLLPALFAAGVRADIFHLRGGGRVEGRVIDETDGELTIRTKFGTVTYARSEIASVEKRATPEEIYEAKREEAETPDELRALIRWAEANNHRGKEVRAELREEIADILRREHPERLCPECRGCGDRLCTHCGQQGVVREACTECGSVGRLQCPRCQGQNQVPCTQCAGTGQRLMNCGACAGTGTITCPGCRGGGRRPCDYCRGRGFIVRHYLGATPGEEPTTVRERCPNCDGSASYPCDVCIGLGQLECPQCNGRGQVSSGCRACQGGGNLPCPGCRGAGTVNCPRCHGTRFVEHSCPDCHGRIFIVCERCGGEGLLPEAGGEEAEEAGGEAGRAGPGATAAPGAGD